MQTYLVHMREPRRLWRELGAKRFLGFQVLMGGLILSALVHPWFYVLLAFDAWQGRLLDVSSTMLGQTLLWVGGLNLIAGYVSAIALGSVAAARRGRRRLAVHALLMPFYWLAISFAAYRALWQLAIAPYYWEKTEHSARFGVFSSAPTRPSGAAGQHAQDSQREVNPVPAKSKAQQEAAGAALAAKRGEIPVGQLKGASLSMFESMTEKQLEDFAATSRKGLPEHKERREH